jgi:hypothetical protein
MRIKEEGSSVCRRFRFVYDSNGFFCNWEILLRAVEDAQLRMMEQ